MKRNILIVLLFICPILVSSLTPSNYSQALVQTEPLYLPSKYSKPRTTDVTHVMIHFISNAGKKPRDPYNIKEIYDIFLNYGVSTHYMIGRDGKIFRLVSENRVASHAGKGYLSRFPSYTNRMNDHSIGIEILGIGKREEMMSMMSADTYYSIPRSFMGFTEAQYASLNRLLDDILTRHPAIKRNRNYIIGHEEYAPNRKTDPGELFAWRRVDFTERHMVRSGETLWAIANRYGVTIRDITTLNNIDPNKYLRVGQLLRIPAMYTVLSGDTLWRIAQKYEVSVASIVKLNNLNWNDYLQVGQRLKLPSATISYTVKAGDTLWKIAQMYNVTIDSIVKRNNLNPNSYLQVGQRLVIPR